MRQEDTRTVDTTPERPYGVAPDGFRLPDGTRLGSVRLQVRDLARSLAYYERVLGFCVVTRTPDRASLAAHGDDHVLVSLHARSDVRPVRPHSVLGLYHFAILLPKRASLGRFVRHLDGIGARAAMSDHAVSEAVYLTDPDGLAIEVYADRPRATWRHDHGQLVMESKPLDVRGLVGAAGDTHWSGMPAGTAIGHVHLHVGDLAEASAFYHSALGFDRIVWTYPGALFLSAGGYHHHLGTNTWSPGPPAADDQARLLSWDIVVPEARHAARAAQSLAAAGYDIENGRDGWKAVDPWGTPLLIVADEPDGERPGPAR